MNILRFIHTVRNFEADQIRQKMLYSISKSKAARSLYRYPSAETSSIFPFNYCQTAIIPKSYQQGKFSFLNNELSFEGSPPWNENKFGKLWNLRLNSFEYLLQEDLSAAEGVKLLNDFVHHSSTNKTLYDSYSVSQRIINWTTFFSKHSVEDRILLNFLYHQALYLSTNPEFHLRNNHLLENGFALLKASVFFQDKRLKKAASKIIVDGLNSKCAPS